MDNLCTQPCRGCHFWTSESNRVCSRAFANIEDALKFGCMNPTLQSASLGKARDMVIAVYSTGGPLGQKEGQTFRISTLFPADPQDAFFIFNTIVCLYRTLEHSLASLSPQWIC